MESKPSHAGLTKQISCDLGVTFTAIEKCLLLEIGFTCEMIKSHVPALCKVIACEIFEKPHVPRCEIPQDVKSHVIQCPNFTF